MRGISRGVEDEGILSSGRNLRAARTFAMYTESAELSNTLCIVAQ